jgi:hypothetical protein
MHLFSVTFTRPIARTLNNFCNLNFYYFFKERDYLINPNSRPLRVFLCHSSDDKPTVRELYRRLDSEGWIDAWLDEKKLLPGQDWNYEIEQAVEQADIILVCLTKNSVTKEGYIQRELRIILDFADYKPEGTLYIIPLRLEECEPPKRIRRWQYADYFPKSRQNIAYQRLLESLKFRGAHLGISTKLIQQKDEDRDLSSIPPRSASVIGAITSASPAALNARITVLQGVGLTREAMLSELGLYTLGDMLYYYPKGYDKHLQDIIPNYSLNEGIAQKWFRNLMEQVVKFWAPAMVDTLPESIRSAARLIPISEALLNVHFPTSQDKLRAALERLTFNEIFYLQMVLLRQNREWKSVYTKHFSINGAEIMEKARSEAQKIFIKDAELSLPEHSLLAEALEQFWVDSNYFDDSMF